MQAHHHISGIEGDRRIPAACFDLRARRRDEVEAVSKLLENEYGAGEEVALAVDLRANILADRRPPDIARIYMRGGVPLCVELFFEMEPFGKTFRVLWLGHTSTVYGTARPCA